MFEVQKPHNLYTMNVTK